MAPGSPQPARKALRPTGADPPTDRVGALTTCSLEVVEEHVVAGDLRAALGVLRLPPREALLRVATRCTD